MAARERRAPSESLTIGIREQNISVLTMFGELPGERPSAHSQEDGNRAPANQGAKGQKRCTKGYIVPKSATRAAQRRGLGYCTGATAPRKRMTNSFTASRQIDSRIHLYKLNEIEFMSDPIVVRVSPHFKPGYRNEHITFSEKSFLLLYNLHHVLREAKTCLVRHLRCQEKRPPAISYV